jgi:hypothetical protein
MFPNTDVKRRVIADHPTWAIEVAADDGAIPNISHGSASIVQNASRPKPGVESNGNEP